MYNLFNSVTLGSLDRISDYWQTPEPSVVDELSTEEKSLVSEEVSNEEDSSTEEDVEYGRIYRTAQIYNQIYESTWNMVSMTYSGAKNSIELGCAFVNGGKSAISNPKNTFKNVLGYSFGANNLSDAMKAIRKQDTEDTVDNRTFPERLGEATSHVGIAASKATFSALLAIGSVSHALDYVPGVDRLQLAENYPTIQTARSMAETTWRVGTGYASFWSTVAQTVTPYAFDVGSQIANISYSAVTTLLENPEKVKTGLVVAATFGMIDVAAVNYMRACESDNILNQITHGTMAAAATIMAVAIPVFSQDLKADVI